MSLFNELKRRSVFRVAIGYIGVSWLIIQVVETLLGIFSFDETIAQNAVIVLAIGFVPAMILAWVFELTPDGIRRDADTDHDAPAMRNFGRRIDRIIIAVLSVAVVFFAIDRFWPTGPPGPSIAVIPFENTSGDPQQDPFAAGMTNQMRSMLNSVRELRVIAEYSVSTFIEEGVDREAMARDLELTHILEGSIQTVGNEVRVTATLVNVEEGTQDWSATFDRDMSDIFSIQDEIAAEVMAQLSFGKSNPISPISKKVDLEAYKSYLRANYILATMHSDEALKEAASLLEQAVDIEPDFVDAWLDLSLASFRLWKRQGAKPGSAMLALSDSALERARQIEPDHPVVLAYTFGGAFMEGGDTQTIASKLGQAIEADPTNPDVIRSARQFVMSIGRDDKALAMAELAVDRDPKCAQCWYVLSQVLRDAGRSKEAEDAGEIATSLGKQGLEFSIAKTQLYQHNADGMLALFDDNYPDGPDSLWGYTMALYTAGRMAEFEKTFAELREGSGEVVPLEVAMVYAWSGRIDDAFEWLKRSIKLNPYGLQNGYRSPFFFNLHGDPRWQEMLREIQRDPEYLAKIEFDPEIPEVAR